MKADDTRLLHNHCADAHQCFLIGRCVHQILKRPPAKVDAHFADHDAHHQRGQRIQ